MTSEIRDGVIGTVQWEPTESLDITLDGQYSNREQPARIATCWRSPKAARGIAAADHRRPGRQRLQQWRADPLHRQFQPRSADGTAPARRGVQRRRRHRSRGKANACRRRAMCPTRRSHRTELQKATNMRSPRRVVYTLDGTDDEVPTVTFDNFDITDPANFLIADAGEQHQLRPLPSGDRSPRRDHGGTAGLHLRPRRVRSCSRSSSAPAIPTTSAPTTRTTTPIGRSPLPYDGRTPAQLDRGGQRQLPQAVRHFDVHDGVFDQHQLLGAVRQRLRVPHLHGPGQPAPAGRFARTRGHQRHREDQRRLCDDHVRLRAWGQCP